jgi:hypothetical protein
MRRSRSAAISACSSMSGARGVDEIAVGFISAELARADDVARIYASTKWRLRTSLSLKRSASLSTRVVLNSFARER